MQYCVLLNDFFVYETFYTFETFETFENRQTAAVGIVSHSFPLSYTAPGWILFS